MSDRAAEWRLGCEEARKALVPALSARLRVSREVVGRLFDVAARFREGQHAVPDEADVEFLVREFQGDTRLVVWQLRKIAPSRRRALLENAEGNKAERYVEKRVVEKLLKAAFSDRRAKGKGTRSVFTKQMVAELRKYYDVKEHHARTFLPRVIHRSRVRVLRFVRPANLARLEKRHGIPRALLAEMMGKGIVTPYTDVASLDLLGAAVRYLVESEKVRARQ